MLNLNQLKDFKNTGCKLIFAGTRPEIIKLAPIYKELVQKGHETIFCATFQHTDLTNQTLEFFQINPEIKLDVAQSGQTLSDLSSKLLEQTGKTIEKLKPSCVIVQGDTMTVLCAAMSAFMHKVPVLHVEAGLRTGDLSSPFPEEANRKICTMLTDLHFAPDKIAFENLISEGCDSKKVFLVGNTVVDSLKIAVEKNSSENCIDSNLKKTIIDLKNRFKKIAIMTMHRRESFDSGLSSLASTLLNFVQKHGADSLAIIYPRHPNPSLDDFCNFLTKNLSQNIVFLPALGYQEFIYSLMQSDFVITDSGGVLEEASILGKSIVCVRKIVERPESLHLNNVFLTGFDTKLIDQALENCFFSEQYNQTKLLDLYGTGDSSKKIVEIIEKNFPKNPISTNLSITPATLDSKITFSEKKTLIAAVFGLGYVGLPTATVLARAGFSVIGIDTDLDRLERIKRGKMDFLEGSLCQDLKKHIENNSLKLVEKLKQSADFFIICVPTPLKDENADLSYIFQCAEPIAKNLKPGSLIILESTVPVGTTEKLEEQLSNLSSLKANRDFFVAYCPERVLPGRMEQEIIENDRVIGAKSPQAFLLANRLYKSFCTGTLSFVDFKSAELIKLLENSFRNVQVAFANEVCDMARELGLNATQIKEIANRHPRVNILNPGPGVGGHCVAVDPFFLEAELKNQYPVLRTAISSNKARPEKIIDQILQKAQITGASTIKKFKILMFGLTYKSNIADLRESPALEIALKLNAFKNLELKVFDPNVEKETISNLGLKQIEHNNIAFEIENADLVAILVAHNQFKTIFQKINISGKEILDSVCLIESIKGEGKSLHLSV